MKRIAMAFAGCVLFSSLAHAGETLGADAVKKLVTGNTAHGLAPNGATPKIYFSPDGKLLRHQDGNVSEGTWSVNDDGTQCVQGTPGGCATIVRNDDGTYDRVLATGKLALKWIKFVNGKDF